MQIFPAFETKVHELIAANANLGAGSWDYHSLVSWTYAWSFDNGLGNTGARINHLGNGYCAA